jgi:hypothetical protein
MDGTSRRSFVKLLSALSVSGVVGAGSASGSDGTPSAVEEFRVAGQQSVTASVKPNRVDVQQIVVSDQLKRRYGDRRVVFKQSVSRPSPADDQLPRTGKTTETSPWEGYYATASDWKRLYTDEVGTQENGGGDLPKETDYRHGVYEYKPAENTTGYAIAAPMNVVSPEPKKYIKDTAVTDHYVGRFIFQHDRYAWNTQTDSFVAQDDTIANKNFRVNGGEHARMWSFEGWTSISAHLDSKVPHEAISFADAEQDFRRIFNETNNWSVSDDAVSIGNDEGLPSEAPNDHDGSATKLKL